MSDIESILRKGRKHLAALQTSAAASAGPCNKCEFGHEASYTRYCQHPAVREGHFSPSKGTVSWTDKRQDEVRSKGPCGPTGLLFIPASTTTLVLKWLRRHVWWFVMSTAFSAEILFIVWMGR